MTHESLPVLRVFAAGIDPTIGGSFVPQSGHKPLATTHAQKAVVSAGDRTVWVLALCVVRNYCIDFDLDQPFRVYKPIDRHDRIDGAGIDAIFLSRLDSLFPVVDIR